MFNHLCASYNNPANKDCGLTEISQARPPFKAFVRPRWDWRAESLTKQSEDVLLSIAYRSRVCGQYPWLEATRAHINPVRSCPKLYVRVRTPNTITLLRLVRQQHGWKGHSDFDRHWYKQPQSCHSQYVPTRNLKP